MVSSSDNRIVGPASIQAHRPCVPSFTARWPFPKRTTDQCRDLRQCQPHGDAWYPASMEEQSWVRLVRQAQQDILPEAALGAVKSLREALEARERVLVRGLRARGASWRAIAAVLGCTRQALIERASRWPEPDGIMEP